MIDSDYQQIMYIRDGGVGEQSMVLGTVVDLAAEMKNSDWTDYEVCEVYGLDQLGDLKLLQWDVRGGQSFDDAGYAYAEVIINHPDGRRESSSYQIDGNA